MEKITPTISTEVHHQNTRHRNWSNCLQKKRFFCLKSWLKLKYWFLSFTLYAVFCDSKGKGICHSIIKLIKSCSSTCQSSQLSISCQINGTCQLQTPAHEAFVVYVSTKSSCSCHYSELDQVLIQLSDSMQEKGYHPFNLLKDNLPRT